MLFLYLIFLNVFFCAYYPWIRSIFVTVGIQKRANLNKLYAILPGHRSASYSGAAMLKHWTGLLNRQPSNQIHTFHAEVRTRTDTRRERERERG